MNQVLVFHIEDQSFGLDLAYIEIIIRVMEVHPYPKKSLSLLGLIYLYEEWIPVVNMRALLGLQDKEIELKDQLIICHHDGQKMALWVDQVEFLISIDPKTISQNFFSTHALTQTLAYYKGKPIFMIPFPFILSLSKQPSMDAENAT